MKLTFHPKFMDEIETNFKLDTKLTFHPKFMDEIETNFELDTKLTFHPKFMDPWCNLLLFLCV